MGISVKTLAIAFILSSTLIGCAGGVQWNPSNASGAGDGGGDGSGTTQTTANSQLLDFTGSGVDLQNGAVIPLDYTFTINFKSGVTVGDDVLQFITLSQSSVGSGNISAILADSVHPISASVASSISLSCTDHCQATITPSSQLTKDSYYVVKIAKEMTFTMDGVQYNLDADFESPAFQTPPLGEIKREKTSFLNAVPGRADHFSYMVTGIENTQGFYEAKVYLIEYSSVSNTWEVADEYLLDSTDYPMIAYDSSSSSYYVTQTSAGFMFGSLNLLLYKFTISDAGKIELSDSSTYGLTGIVASLSKHMTLSNGTLLVPLSTLPPPCLFDMECWQPAGFNPDGPHPSLISCSTDFQVGCTWTDLWPNAETNDWPYEGTVENITECQDASGNSYRVIVGGIIKRNPAGDISDRCSVIEVVGAGVPAGVDTSFQSCGSGTNSKNHTVLSLGGSCAIIGAEGSKAVSTVIDPAGVAQAPALGAASEMKINNGNQNIWATTSGNGKIFAVGAKINDLTSNAGGSLVTWDDDSASNVENDPEKQFDYTPTGTDGEDIFTDIAVTSTSVAAAGTRMTGNNCLPWDSFYNIDGLCIGFDSNAMNGVLRIFDANGNSGE